MNFEDMEVDRAVPELHGLPAPPGIAAFDFDGTLVPGDSLHPYLLMVLGRTRLATALVRSAPAMGLGYRTGGRDKAKAALLLRAMKGIDAHELEVSGQRFGHQLVSQVRPDLGARLTAHRDRGHRIVLVSASLTAYLEPFGNEMGFDDVIATRLEVDADGRLTGLLAGRNVRGPEKAVRLRALLGTELPEMWAYGDSSGDREMLAMADHPTLVNGAPLGPL